ncbi:hypothetical protein A4R43_00450 [Amycolatopsis albispora]|uniref:Uncharacterized protein n=1 Tax=Amycolatopsis albispora TaxID=1804986 RepID=A0A344KZE6_9PSEU|nr:hypothetical protein A4R43_00450 [Amycolatopsis albispora]
MAATRDQHGGRLRADGTARGPGDRVDPGGHPGLTGVHGVHHQRAEGGEREPVPGAEEQPGHADLPQLVAAAEDGDRAPHLKALLADLRTTTGDECARPSRR